MKVEEKIDKFSSWRKWLVLSLLGTAILGFLLLRGFQMERMGSG